jgi:hypothetical protein
MKSVCIAVLLLTCLVASGIRQARTAPSAPQPEPPLSLTIAPDGEYSVLGSPVIVHTALTNKTDRKITIAAQQKDCDYVADVWDANNQLLAKTKWERELNCGGPFVAARYVIVILRPGESSTDDITVSGQREMTSPGKYVVQITRVIYDGDATMKGLRIPSNKITITLKSIAASPDRE